MAPAGGGIACAGNWIVDIVHTIPSWPRQSDLVRISDEVAGVGGGAANVALDLAALQAGHRIFAVGLTGTDLHAHLIRETCVRANIDTRWLGATEAAPTAHTHVMTIPGDSRTFFYHPGANDLLSEADVPVAELAAAGVTLFYLGYPNLLGALDSIGTAGQTGPRMQPQTAGQSVVQNVGRTGAARLLARARAAGMITCVDLVSSDGPDFAAVVAALLPATDYLFANEVEAARASGIDLSGPDDRAGFAAAAAALLARGARCIIMHSPLLTLWQAPDRPPLWSVPKPVDPSRIASPLGAGDAFCAGAVHGLHQGWEPAQCLRLAHLAASAVLGSATATGGIQPLDRLMPKVSSP